MGRPGVLARHARCVAIAGVAAAVAFSTGFALGDAQAPPRYVTLAASVPAASLAAWDGRPAPPEVLRTLALAARLLGPTSAPSAFSPVRGGLALAGRAGRPALLFIGAEYCPYCAVERWAVVLALMRFGRLDGLRLMTSSAADLAPNTATFTFAGATYRSPYLAFDAVEMTTNRLGPSGAYAPLQRLTAGEEAIFRRYDPGQAIPFLAMGEARVTGVSIGAPYDPAALTGIGWGEVSRAVLAAAKGDRSAAPWASAIVSQARGIVAGICRADGGRPREACG
jgi:hypothetical protein